MQVASEVEPQNGLLGRAFPGLPGSPTGKGGFGQASTLRTFLHISWIINGQVLSCLMTQLDLLALWLKRVPVLLPCQPPLAF